MIVKAQAHVHDRASVRKFSRPLECRADGMRNAEDGQVWLSLFFITAPNNPRTLHLQFAIAQKCQPDLTFLHAMSGGQKITPLVDGRHRPIIRILAVKVEGVFTSRSHVHALCLHQNSRTENQIIPKTLFSNSGLVVGRKRSITFRRGVETDAARTRKAQED
jgi:hypothetical protein